MQSDLPHTLYKKKKDSGRDGGKRKMPPVRANDPAFALQQQAYEEKLARMKAKQEGRVPYTMNDIIRK